MAIFQRLLLSLIVLSSYTLPGTKGYGSALRAYNFETLTTYDDHINFFKRSLALAKKEVIICSHVVRWHSMRQAKILPIIEDAVERNIKVEIFMRGEAGYTQKRGPILLAKTGAIVAVKLIHAKHLIIDNDCITFGSFNWLSAAKGNKDKPAPYETTKVFYGDFIKNDIERIKADLAKLKTLKIIK